MWPANVPVMVRRQVPVTLLIPAICLIGAAPNWFVGWVIWSTNRTCEPFAPDMAVGPAVSCLMVLTAMLLAMLAVHRRSDGFSITVLVIAAVLVLPFWFLAVDLGLCIPAAP